MPPEMHVHGPQNAEHELRKAYNALVEAELAQARARRPIDGVDPDEVARFYRHAYRCFRDGNRLAAERWARTAKHLARAVFSEAKIEFLKTRLNLFPFLPGAMPSEYGAREGTATTADLLRSVSEHVPAGHSRMPEPMNRFLGRGRKHLEALPGIKHELLHAEHTRAAYEYGRVLECMGLAYEAEEPSSTQAA